MRVREEAEAEEQQSRVLYNLCSIIIHTLKFPPLPFPFPTPSLDSPAAFASLFLGISLALMGFGSITFLVGLLLLPSVTLLVLLFYVATLLSNLSEFARFILSSITFPKDLPCQLVFAFVDEANMLLKL